MQQRSCQCPGADASDRHCRHQGGRHATRSANATRTPPASIAIPHLSSSPTLMRPRRRLVARSALRDRCISREEGASGQIAELPRATTGVVLREFGDPGAAGDLRNSPRSRKDVAALSSAAATAILNLIRRIHACADMVLKLRNRRRRSPRGPSILPFVSLHSALAGDSFSR